MYLIAGLDSSMLNFNIVRDHKEIQLFSVFDLDQIKRNNIYYDGYRLIVHYGFQSINYRVNPASQLKFFYYKMIKNLNIAAHFLNAKREGDYFASQFFLGGFDSIRGLPDGAINTNNLSYANL